MDENGRMRISRHHFADDYLDLKLTVYSPERDWNDAINMFQERIEGRFLEPINDLFLDEDSSFASAAIICLLIETFYQFREGLDTTDQFHEKIGKKYASFLQKAIPDLFPDIDTGIMFYENIRCGILHAVSN